MCYTNIMFWKRRLRRLYEQDQDARIIYAELVDLTEGSWQVVRDRYISQGRDPDDIFEDISSGRQRKAQRIIKRHINKILLDEELLGKAWLLVQHMDDDVIYQFWFLDQLPGDSLHRRYLYDRICVNLGAPQKYNTQIKY